MKKPNHKYDITFYDGLETSSRIISNEELEKIATDQYDCVIDHVNGVFSFRLASGERMWYEGDWPGLGPVTLILLQTLQMDPGKFLSPRRIADLTDYPSLSDHGALAQRVRVLRRIFGSRCNDFIESRRLPYRLRWRKECTWLWIDHTPVDQ